jgi:hypothetical protein
MWAEGNYSCDCNRALFFAMAVDEEDTDVSCGEKGYSVRIVDGDNKQVYIDGVWGTEK